MAYPGDVCLPRAAGSGITLRGAGERASGDDRPSRHLTFERGDGEIAKMAVFRADDVRVIGRYRLGPTIAAGGMATVHIGRLQGPAGFSRTVAIKRLRAELAQDPAFVARFVDEARIASRVRHANVVQTLDVVSDGALARVGEPPELLLVLDYVHGESLAKLRRRATAGGTMIPPHVVSAIIVGSLRGLHAAHEATTAKGAPLHLVHRDVSPQNVIVGVDGVARVIDFGIAKAVGRLHQTVTNDFRGKVAYMAPEQLSGTDVDRRCDLFGVGTMLWEALAGERLFRCEDAVRTMDAVFKREPAPLTGRIAGVTADVDAILARALAKNAEGRFATADEMARALEAAIPPASDREVAEWVERIAGRELVDRAAQVASFEREANTESGVGTPSRTIGSLGGSIDVDMTKGGGPGPGKAPSSRNALVPPPLEDEIRDRAPTLSTMQEALSGQALADAVPANDATDDEPVIEPLRTPMEMIAPAGDETRAQPAFVRPVKRSDPIPMPLPPLSTANRGSMIRIALLVGVPPIAALIAVLFFRPTAEPQRINAAAEPPPAFVDPTPPPPVVHAPPVATPAPAPIPTPAPSPTVTSPPKPSAAPRPAPPRVPVRVWRPTPRAPKAR